MLEPLQGIQRYVCKEARVRPYATGQADPVVDQTLAENQCGFLEVVEGTGKLTPAEYDQLIYDLVNFLEYVGEPSKAKAHSLGIYVLLVYYDLLCVRVLIEAGILEGCPLRATRPKFYGQPAYAGCFVFLRRLK